MVRLLRARRLRLAVTVLVVLLAGVAAALAQRRFGGEQFFGGEEVLPNPKYDGQFTFVRLRYGPRVGFVSQRVPWSHDYPVGEQHFMKILNELSNLNPHIEETSILALDDAELFKFPVAYLCEPGDWVMTDREALTFRKYLQKGGFLIVDDFRFQHWDNFEQQMRRILPDVQFFDLDASHPIFHSFFEINDLNIVRNHYDPGEPIFRGIFEDNDPSKRLIAIINYNTDISEYWEFSETGLKPVDETNEAYKIGVNYIIYGMTH
ncbi:MAG: hypothetical protein A3G76_05880 [Acidobacteria bacterium RIFCSPLOWO2_12_FULL_65_11]|nr:MAG: hypothetical protein A3H95_11085 [Acidobacteria bacterium RIFCSPLOWO2_02_FULL_64_15]OFW28028.1 MAG: hypothetical protein A3G76_05880 [Acidobacteria bacterium RIFCSPLOWO2_12_FULL_65_11]